ncbi:protein Aster-A-like isoform X5 [Clavelina lepadiformis]|uniref:protein Aster-A-like isoform X5 n=1 Tax=Clavelina lepadiformis TaxID=159417 RepID=UPI0040410112
MLAARKSPVRYVTVQSTSLDNLSTQCVSGDEATKYRLNTAGGAPLNQPNTTTKDENADEKQSYSRKSLSLPLVPDIIACNTDGELTSPSRKSTAARLFQDGDYDSDSSWATNKSAESDIVAEQIDSNKSEKPKKAPTKLKRMKKMLKKTFSDADATPDVERLDLEWKKAESASGDVLMEAMERADYRVHTKHKRKVGKSKKAIRGTSKKSNDFQVLSPSYKQKNDDFHKFFKQLPETERLLVDYTCALMKDILVHGRMYVSQNYVCFHSTILKWQTAVMISFKDIAAVTKEKTAKLIPNAIQFQLKNRSKSTFASFTQRDRAYQLVYRLWQNALLDKPMTPQELWNSIHHQYGNDLGCSSDDDYMRPVFNVTLDSPTGEVYEYGTTNKVKRKKKHKKVKQGNRLEVNGDFNGMSTHVASQNNKLDESIDQSSEEDKFSSSGSLQESLGNEVGLSATDGRLFNEQDDDEPVENVMPDLSRVYLRREFGVSADTMFDTIYGDNCPFWKQYLMNKQTFDINMGKWQDGTDENRGNKVRYLDYNLTLTNPLGPKSSRVEETQVWYNESVLGRYAVDCVARTLGIPYADYFATVMRYCIRKVTGSTCELKISAELKFLKSPWGLVKSFIEKNAYSGIEENFLLLEKELDAYFTRQSHLPVQFPAVSKPRNDLPRRQPSGSSVSKQGHKKSRSSNEGSPRRSTDNNYLLEDVSSSRSELRKREMIAAPSTTSIAPVSLDLNNNKSSLKQSYHKEFGSRKWFPRIVALLFALLLFSNYTMYQRLNSLEVSHSRISSTNSLGISTANAHNIYEPSRTDDDSIAKSLENLDHRLARLEKVVQTHMSTSDTRWMELMSDWKTLHTTIQEILLKVNSHVNT